MIDADTQRRYQPENARHHLAVWQSQRQVDLTVTYYDDKGDHLHRKIHAQCACQRDQLRCCGNRHPNRGKTLATGDHLPTKRMWRCSQPGSLFTLELAVQNLGNASAQNVTMIIGGGSTGGSGQAGPPSRAASQAAAASSPISPRSGHPMSNLWAILPSGGFADCHPEIDRQRFNQPRRLPDENHVLVHGRKRQHDQR